jgi:hypothetical protein
MIKKTYIGLHVKFPFFLSDFDGTWISLTDFRKNAHVKCNENPSGGSLSSLYTDRTKLTVGFCNFANVRIISLIWDKRKLNLGKPRGAQLQKAVMDI